MAYINLLSLMAEVRVAIEESTCTVATSKLAKGYCHYNVVSANGVLNHLMFCYPTINV